VPYTVYRQVEQEVGVKQPCYEKAEVQVCRHVCENCGGLGCKFCKGDSDCPKGTDDRPISPGECASSVNVSDLPAAGRLPPPLEPPR
jgi:hypothetical protein